MITFVALLYLGASIVLLLYGLNFLYLSYLSGKKRTPENLGLESFPSVTVQLPILNERYVCKRLIDAVCSFDYPREKLSIQVLDDSTDETRKICRELVEHYFQKDFDISYIHKNERVGYKAGALQNGLYKAKGEFIAIFDADFVPPRDFLMQVLPYLKENVGLVQTRWGHLNEDYSYLTKAQGLSLDGHFLIEQRARSNSNFFINFNGTAGVWRKRCILDAGGWTDDTLVEDMDLSYRAQLKGWKFIFLSFVVCPAELPVQINSFKRQQFRWAKGSIECALKFSNLLFIEKLSRMKRLQGFLHLTRHLVHPLMLVQLLLLPILMFYDYTLLPIISVLCLLLLGPPAYLLLLKRSFSNERFKKISHYPILAILGIGSSLNNTKAVFEALLGIKSGFKRTPKFGILQRKDKWRGKKYALPFSPLAFFELLLGFYALLALGIASYKGYLLLIPYLSMFTLGFLYVGALSFLHSQRETPVM
ncbi:MAG: glycosyltransferase [Candidatus Methanofastidiosia archaeon]